MKKSLEKLLNIDESGMFVRKDQSYKGYEFDVYSTFFSDGREYVKYIDYNSLEFRGLTTHKNEIICRPMPKFFNYTENDLSTIKQHNVDVVTEKMDGSLISTVIMPDGTIDLKSKSSFGSDHVIAARRIFSESGLKFLISEFLDDHPNVTIDMELTSPELKIVVLYEDEMLTVLNARHNVSGSRVPYHILKKYFGRFMTPKYDMSLQECIDESKQDANLKKEGFVAYVNGLKNVYAVKFKRPDYLKAHSLLNLNDDKKLYCLIVDDLIDDIIPLLKESDVALYNRVMNMMDEISAARAKIFNDIKIINDQYCNIPIDKLYVTIKNDGGFTDNSLVLLYLCIKRGKNPEKILKKMLLDLMGYEYTAKYLINGVK